LTKRLAIHRLASSASVTSTKHLVNGNRAFNGLVIGDALHALDLLQSDAPRPGGNGDSTDNHLRADDAQLRSGSSIFLLRAR
jgi:hypothetical protein